MKKFFCLFLLLASLCSSILFSCMYVINLDDEYGDTDTILDPNTLLLLHFEGDFKDSSMYDNTIDTFNNVSLISDCAIGSSAMCCNAASVDYISTEVNSSLFNIGTGDFTVEFFAKCTNLGENPGVIQFNENPEIDDYHFVQLVSGVNGLEIDWQGGNGIPALSTFTAVTWVHFAISRENGTLRMYYDGVKVRETGAAALILGGNDKKVYIGKLRYNTQDYDFAGCIDEVRISNVARYTTDNFTVPTTPLN